MEIHYQPIGIIHSPFKVIEGMPIQPIGASKSNGTIELFPEFAEGLKDPKTEIIPIIKWVGERKQIFNVHLRNIKGGWDHFQEVYPDNGDMDFFEVVKAFRDVEYPYMLMPDHVPYHADRNSESQGLAFAYGYIKALILAVSMEA